MMRPSLTSLALVLAFGAAACGDSYQSACESFCDKGFDCGGINSARDLEACKQDCSEAEAEAQRDLDRGVLTEACYDAYTDLLGCANGASCAELEAEEPPPECVDEVARADQACSFEGSAEF